jgi:hypothetical protein
MRRFELERTIGFEYKGGEKGKGNYPRGGELDWTGKDNR